MVSVLAYPRLHFTLIDMGNVTGRAYGGVGIAVSGPSTLIRAERNTTGPKLNLAETLDDRTRQELEAALERLGRDEQHLPVTLTVEAHTPQHIGLGSKTALILGTLAAARASLDLAISDEEIQAFSSRGRVSGVGINTFFRGGAVVDCGQPRNLVQEFVPSSVASTGPLSLMVTQFSIPESWRVHLFLPDGIRRTQQEEREFFRSSTPIPDAEVLSVIAAVYHGVVPALLSDDLPLLRQALIHIHSNGFKQRELLAQSPPVRTIYQALVSAEAGAVGLSSLGPIVFAIARRGSIEEQRIGQVQHRLNSEKLAVATPVNTGFEVK